MIFQDVQNYRFVCVYMWTYICIQSKRVKGLSVYGHICVYIDKYVKYEHI